MKAYYLIANLMEAAGYEIRGTDDVVE